MWWCASAGLTHHVSQPHCGVGGVVLHQRVVVGGEERAAADLLRQLLHHGTGDGGAVVGGRAPACKDIHKKTCRDVQKTLHILFPSQGTWGGTKVILKLRGKFVLGEELDYAPYIAFTVGESYIKMAR